MTGLYRKWQEDPSYLSGGQSISCVYVQSRNAFQEVDDFVEACNKKYHLDTTTLTMGMKEALACFLERNSNVKAIFVGIRRTDPFGAELKFFQQTDHGWPDFIRIHPVIDWHLKHIWEVSIIDSYTFLHPLSIANIIVFTVLGNPLLLSI